MCVRAPDSAARDDHGAGGMKEKSVCTLPRTCVCQEACVPVSTFLSSLRPMGGASRAPSRCFLSVFKPETVRLGEAVVCNQIHPPVTAIMGFQRPDGCPLGQLASG